MKPAIKQFFSFLLGIMIIVYTVFQLSLTTGTVIETEHAFYSEISEAVTAEAYIFRDETIIRGNLDGVRSYNVDNGEKVYINQELCVTYDDTNQAEIQRQIRQINQKIDILTQSNGGYFGDLAKTNDSINDYMMRIQDCISRGDLKTATRLQSSLLIQMNRRKAIIEGNSEYFNGDIAALAEEKATLESQLVGEKDSTTAPNAGYFYTEVDGYENIFSTAALDGLSIDSFKKLTTTAVDTHLADHAVGKIAKSSKWYIAFVCNRREAVEFDEDSKYTVAFPYSETKIDMVLERKSGKTGSDEIFMVFSTHTLLNGFNFTRKQEISVEKESTEGLKVRTSALRNENGQTGVYVLSGNTVVFKTAKVIKENGGFYLVELPNPDDPSVRSSKQLSLHDQVILSGKNLYVGKVLQ